MKLSKFHRPNVDFRSIGFQTALELAVGGVVMVLLIRWIQS